jgi:hypothetical protein
MSKVDWSTWIASLDGKALSRESIDNYAGLTPISREWLRGTAKNGWALYPYHTLTRESGSAEVASYTVPALLSGTRIVTEKGLQSGLDSGFTLKVQFLETFAPNLLDLVAPLARLLKGSVTVYGFLTPPGTRSVNVHRDASSVVVLQLEGQKTWHVWEPPIGAEVPSVGRLEPAPPGAERSFTLNPGDAMFLPFGWPHAADGVGDAPSLHLTWTIDQLSPAALSSFLDRVPQPGHTAPETVVEAARHAYGYGHMIEPNVLDETNAAWRRPVLREQISIYRDGWDCTDLYFTLHVPGGNAPRLLSPASLERDLLDRRCAVLMRRNGMLDVFGVRQPDHEYYGTLFLPKGQWFAVSLPFNLALVLEPRSGDATVEEVTDGASDGVRWTVNSLRSDLCIVDLFVRSARAARSPDVASWHELNDAELLRACLTTAEEGST